MDINLNINLTKKEADYLAIEMNCILRQYKQVYNGECFDNNDMANAFNKVYKALTGKDHENIIRYGVDGGVDY